MSLRYKIILMNQCKCILFWIPKNVYHDFNFQINEIHIFTETYDDLF